MKSAKASHRILYLPLPHPLSPLLLFLRLSSTALLSLPLPPFLSLAISPLSFSCKKYIDSEVGPPRNSTHASIRKLLQFRLVPSLSVNVFFDRRVSSMIFRTCLNRMYSPSVCCLELFMEGLSLFFWLPGPPTLSFQSDGAFIFSRCMAVEMAERRRGGRAAAQAYYSSHCVAVS